MLRRVAIAFGLLSTNPPVIVPGCDAQELRAIRDGAWSHEELVERAEALGDAVREAAHASALPEKPDAGRLDSLCSAIVDPVLR